MKNIKENIYICVVIIVLILLYHLIVTLFAQIFFYDSANGSIVYEDGNIVGSRYIGQNFKDKKYFYNRDYIMLNGRNISFESGKREYFEEKIRIFLKDNPTLQKEDIPIEMITSSASGVDPNISKKSALLQVERIAKENGIGKEKVISLIEEENSEIVNVLELNLKLKKINLE